MIIVAARLHLSRLCSINEAKKVIDANPEQTMRMGIINSWNEFGEGGYIEPTKKWRFQYLQAIKDVFGQ